MTLWVKTGGIWKRSVKPFVNDVIWKTVRKAFVKDGGIWKQFYGPVSKFVDSSPYNNIINVGDTAEIDTNIKKFGAGAMNVIDTDSYAEVAVDNLRIGTADFCIDFWIYARNLANFQNVVFSLGDWEVGDDIELDLSHNTYAGININNNPYYYNFPTVSENIWTHIALTRESGHLRVFVDGIMKIDWTGVTHDIAAATSVGLRVGGLAVGGLWFFDGFIDEFRIVIGDAIYVSDFTPPTSAYSSPGANTKLLLHFD